MAAWVLSTRISLSSPRTDKKKLDSTIQQPEDEPQRGRHHDPQLRLRVEAAEIFLLPQHNRPDRAGEAGEEHEHAGPDPTLEPEPAPEAIQGVVAGQERPWRRHRSA